MRITLNMASIITDMLKVNMGNNRAIKKSIKNKFRYFRCFEYINTITCEHLPVDIVAYNKNAEISIDFNIISKFIIFQRQKEPTQIILILLNKEMALAR